MVSGGQTDTVLSTDQKNYVVAQQPYTAPTICFISTYILSSYLYCLNGHPTWHNVGETGRSESAT